MVGSIMITVDSIAIHVYNIRSIKFHIEDHTKFKVPYRYSQITTIKNVVREDIINEHKDDLLT